MPTKQEVIGQQILQRIHTHNTDQGGVLTETTGAMGSAKTSVNLSFTNYTLNKYPNEKVFWSECYESPLQIFKLNRPDKIQFLVHENTPLVFRDRNDHLAPVDLHPRYFSSFEEMYQLAKPGHVNVVFLGERMRQMELISFLRSVGEWVHVYVEEFSEIAPMFTSGEDWQRVKSFAKTLKDVRKCMMNVHYNTQSVTDIHHECRGKVMIKIFLPGAVKDKNTRVTQRAIDNLEKNPVKGNQAYLVQGGEFGVARFSDIFKPVSGYHIDAHLEEKL